VTFKDYYQILGVPRGAGEEEIKKAFRKLARQFHPDVAKDKKAAEEKFKEINEAYEVLGDPDKRRKYDELGADWKSGGEFRPPPGAGGQRRRSTGGSRSAEYQFGGTGFSDFFEQFFSSRRGGGAFTGEDGDNPALRGQDVETEIMVTLEEAARGALRPISLTFTGRCDACGGSGRRRNVLCSACAGLGKVTKSENYQLKIPVGVREGQKLRLAGRGEAGFGGGPAGDLFLRVRLARHPDFRVEGDDLHYELPVAPWEAVLGATVSVPTLGKPVVIKIPPGAQNGLKLRVRGHGLPRTGGGPGDLLVTMTVQTPGTVGEPERALWEKLAHESRFNPRD